MRIEADLKLGFKDVLIRPKRSTLKSRAQVSLERTFTFMHSRRQWTGVPVIAANMDTVGTFESAAVLARFGMLTAIHKHYGPECWQRFLTAQDDTIFERIMVSTGTAEDDYARMKEILALAPQIQFICIDVANGYAEAFVDFVQKVRNNWPDKTIVAGNVVTGEMVEELLLRGPISSRSASVPARSAPRGSKPASAIRNSPRSSNAPMRPMAWADASFPMGAAPARGMSPRPSAAGLISSCLVGCLPAMTKAAANWCSVAGRLLNFFTA